jgi:hypothetical protein
VVLDAGLVAPGSVHRLKTRENEFTAYLTIIGVQPQNAALMSDRAVSLREWPIFLVSSLLNP